ncbi:hypothetical protein [Crateriforma spongiae]|uniref:hypothetical protein n=1 Tax=Crateriforma spongiae TaxID=2724528 RepID=UPI0039B0EEC9
MSLPLTETEIITKLRSLIDAGMDIDTAIKQLHEDDDLGILLLFRPYMIASGVSAAEAKRRLVRAIPYEGCDD